MKMKFHDKPLYNKWEQDIKKLKEDNKRRIKILKATLPKATCEEEKEYIEKRIKFLQSN